jgi:hypothetical protein
MLKLYAEKTEKSSPHQHPMSSPWYPLPLELDDALITPSPVVRNFGVLLDSHLR